MNTINNKDGARCLPLVWTMALTKKEDLFIEPFSLRKLRYRCIFKKVKSAPGGLAIYFHLSGFEEFKDLSTQPDSLYFYGAYNQLSVCQMRSWGNIREMTPREKNQFIRLVPKRLAGADIGDKLPLKPTAAEKEEALRLMALGGKFYRFDPIKYACGGYDRG